MTTKDMKIIHCEFCLHTFFKSDVYKEHMKLEHPGRPLQKIIPWIETLKKKKEKTI